MATVYTNKSFTGNDSIIEECIVKETDIKTDVYESLQKTKDCEVYQTLEKSKTNQKVDSKRCNVISRKKMIYVFLILLSVTVIGTLTGVIILFASTTKTDVCQSRPCHAGICISRGDSFDCVCLSDNTGRLCEKKINECESNPCLHGSCTDLVNGYNCSCFIGYSGLNCQTDIDECTSVTCGNGTCIDGIGNYSCSCNVGFGGTNCDRDINECSSVTCGNGTCINGIGNYSCSCTVGFDGTNCDHNINECSSVTCGNGTCIDGIGNYSCSCNAGFGGTNCDHVQSDCIDILRYFGNREDGVYTIRTWKSHQLIKVYCDMTTDGGGWTMFQYRFNGSVDFYRNFSLYEQGFGNLKTEFWLGLRYIEEIASKGRTDLRIDLEAPNGTTGFETFDNFSLSAGPAYTLHLGSTIAFSRISDNRRFGPYHNGSDFSTYDHDADPDNGNCAVKWHGAWWYKDCYEANLNGKYLTPGTYNRSSMTYQSFLYLVNISLKSSKMMMRRKSE